MERNIKGPRDPRDKKPEESSSTSQRDLGIDREGGDDSLAESSPTDIHSDEKVIVNEQRANKTVNAPSQTAANTSEGNSFDDEIIDQVQNSDE